MKRNQAQIICHDINSLPIRLHPLRLKCESGNGIRKEERRTVLCQGSLTELFMFHDAMKIRSFLSGKTRNNSVSLMRGDEPMFGAEATLEEAL